MKTYFIPFYRDYPDSYLDICNTREEAQRVIDGWAADCEEGSDGANPNNYSIKIER